MLQRKFQTQCKSWSPFFRNMPLLYPFLFWFLHWLQLCFSFTENGREIPPEFILTPLIRNGNISRAKSLSKVEPFPEHNFTSYAGYLTIDETYDSNIYFWYFPAKMDSDHAPVVVFITGGPGISSTFALFGEVGPFYALPNMTLMGREYDWSKEFNLLFMDFPAGAGFSVTKSIKGYAKTHEDIGRQGFQFLQQFFALFSEHRTNDLYIAGESFAGAYPFYIAQVIAEENSQQKSELIMNLKGVISVSGVLDNPAMYLSSEYYYNIGILTEKDKNFIKAIETKAKKLCEESLYHQCFRTLEPMTFYDLHSYMNNITGYDDFSNINFVTLANVYTNYKYFLLLPNVKMQIHASDETDIFHDRYTLVIKLFEGSLLKDHKNAVKTALANNFKVLLMTGQLDGYVPPLYQRRFISNLDWNGKDEYHAAERIIWRVEPDDEEVAGYVTSVRNLVEIMVRKAGHMIPNDNPRASWDALKRFVYDKSFS